MTEAVVVTMCREGDSAETVATTCGRAIPGMETRIDADERRAAGPRRLRDARLPRRPGGHRRGDRRRRLAAHRRRRHPRRRRQPARSPTGSRTCTSPAASTSTPPRSSRRWPGWTASPTSRSSACPTSGWARSARRTSCGTVDRRTTVIAFAKERLANFKVPAAGRARRRAAAQPVRQGAKTELRRLADGLCELCPSPSWPSRPRRGPGWRPTCRPSRCRRWTPPRASSPTRSGSSGSPTPAGRSCPGPRSYHGREASLVEWVIFEEEYYRAGAPGRVSPERHLPARADHLRPRHPGAAGPLPADDGDRRADLGAVLVRARGRLRPRLAAVDRPPRRRARRLGAQRPEDLVVAGGVRALGLRAVPLRPGGRSATTGSPTSSSRSTPTASRSARSPSSTARPASPRCSSRTSSSPTPTCSARPATAGGSRCRTAGNERGLSLRSPGRFCAAADRLVDLYREQRREPAHVRRDGVVDAWIKAQAYRLYTWGTVTRLADGGDMGAAGSVNKVFWSELDIALHETALDLLGPEAEVESTLAGRLHVLAVRPDLRRHQRDPAQHRRRADPRPPARAQGSRRR